jgi:hypothetical protein
VRGQVVTMEDRAERDATVVVMDVLESTAWPAGLRAVQRRRGGDMKEGARGHHGMVNVTLRSPCRTQQV